MRAERGWQVFVSPRELDDVSHQDAVKLGKRKGQAGFLGGLAKDLPLDVEVAPAEGVNGEEAS